VHVVSWLFGPAPDVFNQHLAGVVWVSYSKYLQSGSAWQASQQPATSGAETLRISYNAVRCDWCSGIVHCPGISVVRAARASAQTSRVQVAMSVFAVLIYKESRASWSPEIPVPGCSTGSRHNTLRLRVSGRETACAPCPSSERVAAPSTRLGGCWYG
jgi:hypothetical protein